MTRLRVLVTAPPMLGLIHEFQGRFAEKQMDLTLPPIVQTLGAAELKRLLPEHDGWIAGDDPANAEVLAAGRRGRFRALVKWGIGVDNVDFDAAHRLGIQVANTPAMFSDEVADIALSYVIALARETFAIDRGVRAGGWPKPRGISLAGKTAALVGYGNIGRATARRLMACGMRVLAYDPAGPQPEAGVAILPWAERLREAHFIILTAALTPANRHMIDSAALAHARRGVRIVNVARGPLIDQAALVGALGSGQVQAAALDVFEEEPLPLDAPLRRFEQCVFGSHNASNTVEAVRRATGSAMDLLFGFLEGS